MTEIIPVEKNLPPGNSGMENQENGGASGTQDAEQLKEQLRTQRDAVRKQNERTAKEGSAEIAQRLQAASVSQKAKKWLASTDGAKEGVVRSLEISDVGGEVADRVLDRYGIKIMVEYMDGKPKGYSFLNQAQTAGGTYFNRSGQGVFQVFSYSQAAVAKMMQLEVAELQRRGMDPARTRVIEVHYGIVQTTAGYDLGIKKMDAIPNAVEEKTAPSEKSPNSPEH